MILLLNKKPTLKDILHDELSRMCGYCECILSWLVEDGNHIAQFQTQMKHVRKMNEALVADAPTISKKGLWSLQQTSRGLQSYARSIASIYDSASNICPEGTLKKELSGKATTCKFEDIFC